MGDEFLKKKAFHSFVALSCDVGDRERMEDDFCVQVGDSELLYFGVYDGHAGSAASRFVADTLYTRFMESNPKSVMSCKSSLEDMLSTVHAKVDAEFLDFEQKLSCDGEYSGTTSVSLIMNEKEGWGCVANAGDSRAVLFYQGRSIPLSNEHRIHNNQTNNESERITALGGWIEDGRLCGELEPTRGFGDFDFKCYLHQGFPKKVFLGDLVIPTPEYEWFSLTNTPEEIFHSSQCNEGKELIDYGCNTNHFPFIILASDGLWDELSCLEILEITSNYLPVSELTSNIRAAAQKAADELVQKTRRKNRKRKKNPMDNTTIIVITFCPCDDPKNYNTEEASCLFCFEQKYSGH